MHSYLEVNMLNDDILFRGKSTQSGKWLYGFYVRHQKIVPYPISSKSLNEDDFEHLIVLDGFSDWSMGKPIEFHHVDPMTIGRFTGIMDINKKRVFEDDFVRCRDVYKLVYFEGTVCWESGSFYIQSEACTYYRWHDYCVEVIGNLFDGKQEKNI